MKTVIAMALRELQFMTFIDFVEEVIIFVFFIASEIFVVIPLAPSYLVLK